MTSLTERVRLELVAERIAEAVLPMPAHPAKAYGENWGPERAAAWQRWHRRKRRRAAAVPTIVAILEELVE